MSSTPIDAPPVADAPGSPPRRWLALCVLLFLAVPASAQDRVIIRGATSGRVTVTGLITEYLGTRLTLSSATGSNSRTYESSEILEIQTAQSEQYRRGLKLLEEGKPEAALRDFDAAVRVEERAWVRREILAEMVRTAVRINDYGTAGLRFKALLESDPETRHFNRIPLLWAPHDVTDASKAEAREWLNDKNSALRLIGASLLLEDPSSRASAEKVLQEVSSDADPRVRWFAQSQLWRKTLSKGPPNDRVLELWVQLVDDLPESLRAGPKFLLGRAYSARREHELAAASWLWLTLVDDTDRRLAALAGLNAADSLTESGRTVEAENLLRELSVRFPDTAAAAEAEERLKKRP